MDASEEEGTDTGRLRPGLRTVAGVITQETYDGLLALQRERETPTISRTVGEALREWAEARSAAGFKPGPRSEGTNTASTPPVCLKPTDARAVAVQPWEEVRGIVREITEDGPRLRVALQDGGDVYAIILPGPPGGQPIQIGMTVAILRTDNSDREYVARAPD